MRLTTDPIHICSYLICLFPFASLLAPAAARHLGPLSRADRFPEKAAPASPAGRLLPDGFRLVHPQVGCGAG
eukprot:7836664-Pyramimonas_sp.AAC.2